MAHSPNEAWRLLLVARDEAGLGAVPALHDGARAEVTVAIHNPPAWAQS